MINYKDTPKLLIKKPLFFIIISVISGNITYLISRNSYIGVIVFITSIILCAFILIEKNFRGMLLVFFLFSFVSCLFYYSIYENKSSIYTVRIDSIKKNEVLGNFRGRKIYINNIDSNIKTGEILTFKGKFKKSIDVKSGIVGHLFVKDQIKIKKGYKYYINRFSEEYFCYIKTSLGENKSAFLTALVFGNKDFLSYSQKNNLSNLGVIHLICVSGFHISLLFMCINKFLNTKFSLIICLFYIISIGCPISAVRAYIMIFLMILSKKISRNYDSISALCLSAIILIIYKPYILYESGFILSYLATIGIVLFAKIFSKAFYILPNYINKFLSLTLAAQVFIYPYMVLKFNSFSMNFLLAGFLLAPIISIMLPLGFLTIISWLTIKSMSFLYIPINILFVVLNGILIFLSKVSLESVYIHSAYAVFYMMMFICIYMSYSGFKKFNIVFYSMIPLVILFSFYLKITML